MSMAADRITELLAQRATEGLAADQDRLLRQALAANPDLDAEAVDRAAAAANVALISKPQGMPAHLRAAIERDAAQFFGGPTRQTPTPIRPAQSSPAPWPWLAAAAALVLAIAGWWPQGEVSIPTASAEAQYAELLAANALELNWTATEDATALEASGTVLWDQPSQMGFMRFSGLAANDPTQFQYQLWIFDAARGEQYPVDGGVFDIPAGTREITVPIDPRLPINEAILFAVTVEQPGGVVVSTRERITVLAEVS
jgi:anti-sigma-K factor RskA